MSEETILFFLSVLIIVLVFFVFYQRFVLNRGIWAEIRRINEKLDEILENDSDEKVMAFTDHVVLKELMGQINRLLVDRQRGKAEYKRQEISSKKMLANVSHDIKTPLTVILGYLEIMRLSHVEDEMLKKVEAKAKQVMDLINQFFTLAKLESGDMEITLSKINVNEICRENILEFYDILMQKEFGVEVSIPEIAIFALGEKEALQRILNNLLSNVMRYGADGKYLGFFLRQDESNVYIDVADKGKGIGQEYVSSVFDRLYTMEDSRNREIQGNGLGLTIAKNLAERLGGSLSLNSAPNVKTVFTLKLTKRSD